jgi:hypothetical protein
MDALSTCVLSLASALGACIAAGVAIIKANAAHQRLNSREEKKEE